MKSSDKKLRVVLPKEEHDRPTGLDLLREPFPAHQISKLPKPTKAQTDAVRQNFKAGHRCEICGGWHHPKVVHLDYVGHAALTDRLLDCDKEWNWRPLKVDEFGVPVFDEFGGMWIELTVCGVSRMGYGHADGKRGGDAIKEVIGDALRNAAMRFGAALDLWHKGDLHGIEEPEQQETTEDDEEAHKQAVKSAIKAIGRTKHVDGLRALWDGLEKTVQADGDVIAAKDKHKEELSKPAGIDDEIPQFDEERK